MSNSDFFSLFSEDEQSSESLTSLFDVERVPTPSENGATQNPLESLDDIFNNLTFTTDEQPYLLNNLENPTESQLPEPLKEITRSQKVSEISPLTPPFLVEYQDLQQEIEEYKAVLIESERHLEGQARRSRSTDQLIAQQAEELSKLHEQLAYTVAERQVYQEEAQRQQLQIETFTQKIATSQAQTANLERECAHLQETHLERGHQVKILEEQVEDLRVRLQRQQRYSLQYKKALEQCLATPNWNPSSDITSAITSLTGQITPIQPWSSQQLTDDSKLFKFTTKEPSENPENSTQEISPVIPEVSEITASLEEKPQILASTEIPPDVIPETAQAKPKILETELIDTFPSKRDRSFLSFAIHSPTGTTRRPVDLPKFMRQPSVSQ